MAAKKKTKKKAKKVSKQKTTKKADGSAALELARAALKRNPKATFADIKKAAEKKKITIYPITYGRAKALEGLVKVSAYGSAKNKKKKTGKRGPGRPKGSKNKRGPGRPRKRASLNGLDDLVGMIKNLERERDNALKIIEKIRDLVA